MKKQIGFSLALISLLFLFLYSCGGRSREYALYVSPSGSDNWSGRLAEPNDSRSDGPFDSLEKARDTIRALKRTSGLPEGGITVYVRDGLYPFDKTFALSAEDSGTEMSPVTWRAYPGETARLFGGRYVNCFAPVTDTGILERIDGSLRDSILAADLKSLGIDDFGDIDPKSGNRIELLFKGKYMTVARYPNEGWLNIADVPQTGERMINKGLDRDKSPVPKGRNYGRFTYPGDRPKRWSDTESLWVHGYWTWDWSDEYLKVAKLDTGRREITPREPHHNYGYTKNQRFYFLNILEELDSPGEWYLDINSGIVYFLPPSPIEENDVVISMAEYPLVSLDNASFIMIAGFVFEGGRGAAVAMSGGNDNTIAGCAVRNFGQTAIDIRGGKNNGVLSCDIYDVAAGGIDIHGGDRKTLVPAGHFAINNHIHDFGVRLKTYTPAVQTTGVGNYIAHNLIHDAPHCGIFLMTSQLGNDHVIEYNELHSLAKETGDVGAIYLCARDFTMRGNIVRYNYLHDIKGPGQHGAMAIYLDDFTSGTTVYGNICHRASRAILIGGGRNNTVENNIFLECDPSVHVDGRGLGWAKYYFESNNRLLDLMEAVNYKEPPYSEKYPELLTIQEDDPAVPKYNRIVRNISAGGRWLDLYDGLDFSIVTVEDILIADPVLGRWRKAETGEQTEYTGDDKDMIELLEKNGNIVTDGDTGIVDPESADYSLKSGSPAQGLGFKDIPLDKIGLYADEYRIAIPRP